MPCGEGRGFFRRETADSRSTPPKYCLRAPVPFQHGELVRAPGSEPGDPQRHRELVPRFQPARSDRRQESVRERDSGDPARGGRDAPAP